jgi:flagellar motor switch protein FliM
MPNILNQDEIDSLLGAMERGEIDKVDDKDRKSLKIAEYNFRRPNLITKDQLRNFQAIHENFTREMASSLALFLRSQVEFNLVSTEQQLYSEFISSLANISHCVVFSAEPLPGAAIIEVNLSLVFGIVDMLLGGKGDVETEIRVPTEIEVAILNPIIDRVIEKLEVSWKTLMDVTLKKERTESAPEYVQAAPTDAPVVVLAFDAKIGLANGIINICYPLPMIQQVNEYLSEAAGKMDSYYGKKADDETRGQVMDALFRVPIPLSATLGESKIRGRDLMSLKPGDVIILNAEVTDPVEVSISGRPVFFGRPGRIKDKLYVRLGERLSHADMEKPKLKFE